MTLQGPSDDLQNSDSQDIFEPINFTVLIFMFTSVLNKFVASRYKYRSGEVTVYTLISKINGQAMTCFSTFATKNRVKAHNRFGVVLIVI